MPGTGTQSIERAVVLLREIASRPQAGWGLRDLAQHCELDHGTVHRMLKCMLAQGLVQQRRADSRYFIGPLTFELGLSVPGRPGLADAIHVALKKITRGKPQLNSVGFLLSGDDCVCVARAGSVAYTRAENSTRVGQRFPLLAKASGVAMVAAMRPDEAAAVCTRNRRRLAHLGARHLARLDEMVKATRREGYAISEGLIWQGVNSVALAFGPSGAPLGSISLSAGFADHSPGALRKLLPELRAATASLGASSA